VVIVVGTNKSSMSVVTLIALLGLSYIVPSKKARVDKYSKCGSWYRLVNVAEPELSAAAAHRSHSWRALPLPHASIRAPKLLRKPVIITVGRRFDDSEVYKQALTLRALLGILKVSLVISALS
jgi:hypothetical protein